MRTLALGLFCVIMATFFYVVPVFGQEIPTRPFYVDLNSDVDILFDETADLEDEFNLDEINGRQNEHDDEMDAELIFDDELTEEWIPVEEDSFSKSSCRYRGDSDDLVIIDEHGDEEVVLSSDSRVSQGCYLWHSGAYYCRNHTLYEYVCWTGAWYCVFYDPYCFNMAVGCC